MIKQALIKEIGIILVLIVMVLLGFVAIFIENFQNPAGALTSSTVVCFLLGKKSMGKYYSAKRKIKGIKEFFR